MPGGGGIAKIFKSLNMFEVSLAGVTGVKILKLTDLASFKGS